MSSESAAAATDLTVGTSQRSARAEAAGQVRFSVTNPQARGTDITCAWARLVMVGTPDSDPPSQVYDAADAEGLTPNDAPDLLATSATALSARQTNGARYESRSATPDPAQHGR